MFSKHSFGKPYQTDRAHISQTTFLKMFLKRYIRKENTFEQNNKMMFEQNKCTNVTQV